MNSPTNNILSIQLIPSQQRKHLKQGWLEAFHSHSLLPRNSPLQVFNEDCIEANHGFGMHPHQNYEIFTYVLSGELSHYDSMRNAHHCRFGTVQFTSAGIGMHHSEMNKHSSEKCKLLQIWVKPRTLNTPPRYQRIEFSKEKRLNQLHLMIAPKELIPSASSKEPQGNS
ncbi:hypothetical protein FDP41_013085 [Naegleria fowleri]|uniref:Pirin N-terminal domain-containing protein n=1 Tax=Naegleria fowleri TaxID=5763 RepID=A0A6A5C1F4_NAEFO|nr:uncharacterized protein FDP41_013085 [Naegleria fowleri]KAF0980602.1 hypothetical protein FDP41_013085 [Naegleria fowleri]CAG4717555.1 unnamed protein product [Naegleria fowleri]